MNQENNFNQDNGFNSNNEYNPNNYNENSYEPNYQNVDNNMNNYQPNPENHEKEEPKKSNNALLIVFMIISLLLAGYIVYDKAIKKEEVKEPEKPVEVLMTEAEALNVGTEVYRKLEKYQSNLKSLPNASNKENTYEGVYYKYDNFSEEFKSIFASNIKLVDVFRQDIYSEDMTEEQKQDIKADVDGKYSYVNVNNTYYVDAECRASGYAAEFKNLKVEKINKDKLTFSYKFLPEYHECTDDEDSLLNDNCYENMDEYNKSLTAQNNLTLEIVNEENEWKISKVTIQGRCGYTYNVGN